jgi:hypothetical protein
MKRNKLNILLAILLLLSVGSLAYSIINPGSNDAGKDITLLASKSNVPQIIKKETIKIENNSTGYDVNATLNEDSSKATFIKLEYYLAGESRSSTFDSKAVPELADIFSKRANDTAKKDAYRIRNAYLNIKLAKVYLVIYGKQYSKTIQTTLYVINLTDSSIKKIFSNNGKYGSMFFNKNGKYMAYNYDDPLESSILQENTLFEVLDCSKDKLVVKNSRSSNGKRIGPNVYPNSVFDFTLLVWNNENTVKLLQKTVLKDKNGKKIEKQVFYNIPKNQFVNADGNAVNTTSQTVSTNTTKESDALKTLKTCYTYLKSEKDYTKAMTMLDDKFSLKMGILKSFGIEELVKSDLDIENASVYRDIFKSASFDTFVKEEIKDGNVTVYYYQRMGSDPSKQVRFPMCARIVKSDKGWKILSLQDVDGTKTPFVK